MTWPGPLLLNSSPSVDRALLIRSFTILFDASYVIITNILVTERKTVLTTLFAQFFSAWYFSISLCTILTGSWFCLSRMFFKNTSCLFSISYWIGKTPSSRNNAAVDVDFGTFITRLRKFNWAPWRFEISSCVKFHDSQLYISLGRNTDWYITITENIWCLPKLVSLHNDIISIMDPTDFSALVYKGRHYLPWS